MKMNGIDQADVLRRGALGRFQEAGRPGGTDGREPAAATQADRQRSERVEDRAEISAAARRLMEIRDALQVGREAVAALPDVREERVAETRQRLTQGFYRATEVQSRVAEGVGRVFEALEKI